MPAFAVVVFVLALLLLGTAVMMVGYLLWASTERHAYDQPRVIICPENLDYATVTVDGKIAARTALAGHEEFRIATCSRWPEMQGCDQECAMQAALVGDDRSFGKYAAFGMTPEQLRINHPVRMTPDAFGTVMRHKIDRYLNKRPA